MKLASNFFMMLLFIPIAFFACSAPPLVESNSRPEPNQEAATATPIEALAPVEAKSRSEPSPEVAAATRTSRPIPSPTATAVKFQLEVVQSQAWTDRDGNVRVNVLMRNPYEYPLVPEFRARADLLNGAGESVRDHELYFLDGISGGNGFFLPGETIAATACFTCETTPLREDWSSVEFLSRFEDATGSWDYSTAVEASAVHVSLDGDSPIFDIAGTVKNASDSALDCISVRIFVFDQDGNLVGAAEASAWDVVPGASVGFRGYGIGQAPDGPVVYEVTALGVNY